VGQQYVAGKKVKNSYSGRFLWLSVNNDCEYDRQTHQQIWHAAEQCRYWKQEANAQPKNYAWKSGKILTLRND
jgi:hypothetical protein